MTAFERKRVFSISSVPPKAPAMSASSDLASGIGNVEGLRTNLRCFSNTWRERILVKRSAALPTRPPARGPLVKFPSNHGGPSGPCQDRQILAARRALVKTVKAPSKHGPRSGPYYPPLIKG